MNLNFSVPEFPVFRGSLDATDYRRYNDYVRRFENYAAYAVNAQVCIAEKAVEKGYMKDELAILRESVRTVNESAVHCVEKSSMIVESELNQVKEQISAEVAKLSRDRDVVAPVRDAESPVVVVNVANDEGAGCGPNWNRNVRAREARKARKLARQEMGVDWRKGTAAGVSGKQSVFGSWGGYRGGRAADLKVDGTKLASVKTESLVADLPSGVEIATEGVKARGQIGRNGKPIKDESMGFWKSCSDSTRASLIETKAQMHIAENKRKIREAENRVAYLESPQAIVDQVTKLVEKAQDMAAKQGDEKVMGWAKTVTSSSAESLARSVPSTVPSFDSVSSAIDEAVKLSQERAAAAKEEADSENMRRAAELEATNVQLKETIARLEREIAGKAAERLAPTNVSRARVAVPDVNCAPVRRSGETVAEHMERFRKYVAIRDGIQKGGSSAFVFKP